MAADRPPSPPTYPPDLQHSRPGSGYPSPSMSSYNYPPPQQASNEAYRASPTGSNGSISLPSMRALDNIHQGQQHPGQPSMGSPLPPPVAQMGYYHNQGQTLPHPSHQYSITSDPNLQGNNRYPLPQDNRVMSGGRHKVRIPASTCGYSADYSLP